MGFQLPDRIAVMEFEGSDYEGAEVRVKLDVPMAYFFDIQGSLGEGNDLKAITLFVEYVLLGWNLIDGDGQPIPATMEGARLVTHGFINLIIVKWAEMVAGVSDPLDGSSLNGAARPAGYGTMGPPSLALGNLSTPN